MATVWAALRAQILMKLPSDRKFTEGELLVAIATALKAFAAAHTGYASVSTYPADGVTVEFPLPDNNIGTEDAVVGVMVGPAWMRRAYVWPSDALEARNTYLLWPGGTIRFPVPPSKDLTVYYVAFYPSPETDDSVITVPSWAEEALAYYAAAKLLERIAAKTAQLGAFKSRKEAGDPEDNPILRLVEHYYRRYKSILAAHPPPQYSRLLPAGR